MARGSALRASLRACELLHDSAPKIRRKSNIRPAGELLPFQHIEAKKFVAFDMRVSGACARRLYFEVNARDEDGTIAIPWLPS